MSPARSEPAQVIGSYRWRICALLFFATTISYIDRQVLAILAPTLQAELGWSESQYGFIVTAFQAAYALGLLGAGRAIDRFGTRVGYATAVAFWSLAGMAHGLVRLPLGFGLVRFLLGLGEAGNFPAAVKVVAEWFPKRERALATGLFNAGANVGALTTPLLVPWIALHFGWRWAFLLTGALGFAWVIGWLACYRPPQEHPRLSSNELAHILSDPVEPSTRISWLSLCAHRETLGLVAARFVSDPMWWFMLYWVPKFLYSKHGLALDRVGLPLIIIYMTANAGSVFGGWLSGWMIQNEWSVNASRKLAMLACALMIAPIMYTPRASSLWTAVLLMSLATAGQQGWAANLYTLVSDLFPRRTVSSVVGICGFGGAAGGMLMASAAGLILEKTGSYVPLFLLAGPAYFLALLIIHLTSPNLEAVQFGASPPGD
jgi:ACS family hexuronate transporter-like MFS transporter